MLGIQVMGTRMIRSRWAPLIRLKMPLRRLLQAVLLGNLHAKALRDAGNMLATPNGHKK